MFIINSYSNLFLPLTIHLQNSGPHFKSFPGHIFLHRLYSYPNLQLGLSSSSNSTSWVYWRHRYGKFVSSKSVDTIFWHKLIPPSKFPGLRGVSPLGGVAWFYISIPTHPLVDRWLLHQGSSPGRWPGRSPTFCLRCEHHSSETHLCKTLPSKYDELKKLLEPLGQHQFPCVLSETSVHQPIPSNFTNMWSPCPR